MTGAEIVSAGGELRARFVPEANLVCDSLTHRGVQLLHVGRGVRAYAEQGKTMGVPLLHPWANRLAAPGYRIGDTTVRLPPPDGRYPVDPAGLPIHGALPGLLRWELTAREADGLSARLRWDSEQLLALFPFVHELRVDARVTETALMIETTLHATGERDVPVSFGYHPYLRPPGDLPRDRWQVALGASQRLVLDERMIPTGAREPLAPASFELDGRSLDDGLAELASPPLFSAIAGAGALSVTFGAGYPYAQVYAPAGQDLICFEPMTAPANALVSGDSLRLVAPGDTYRAAFTIELQSEWT